MEALIFMLPALVLTGIGVWMGCNLQADLKRELKAIEKRRKELEP